MTQSRDFFDLSLREQIEQWNLSGGVPAMYMALAESLGRMSDDEEDAARAAFDQRCICHS
ncbi:hypothetical protein DMP06_05815 [Slackia equolifaciens]|uniref:Uncharacterized protein n=1 Tax=Slackia equolifaciens TaxID=498718 RepID=A0A3N0AZG8_9ACTN|nr:hypothetical protein DMP06_05815 [Slackia equolifaciens]